MTNKQKDKNLSTAEKKAQDLIKRISSETKDFKKKTSSLIKELDKGIKDEQKEIEKFGKEMADFEKKNGEEIDIIALGSVSLTDDEEK